MMALYREPLGGHLAAPVSGQPELLKRKYQVFIIEFVFAIN